MAHNGEEQSCCPVCGEMKSPWEMIDGQELNDTLRTMVHARRPQWDDGVICATCLLQRKLDQLLSNSGRPCWRNSRLRLS